eukprot:TCONS_00054813-protein
MATPPIAKSYTHGTLEEQELKDKVMMDLTDNTKKNVARILFEDPANKELEPSMCLLLDDSCKDSDRNDGPQSPTLFNASEIPSCGNSYEMSPPITAQKPKRIQKNPMLEHSLGVSLFDSPPRTNNKRKSSSTSTLDETGCDLFGSPPVVSFIKYPLQTISKFPKSPLKNHDEENNEDDVFLSPSIASINIDPKKKMIPKMTQSTPIVSKSTKTRVNVPPESMLKLSIDIKTDCLPKKSVELSPSMIDWNNSSLRLSKTNLHNFTEEGEENDLDLSPSVIQPSKSTNTTTVSKHQEGGKSTNDIHTTLEKSSFNLSNLPLHFEVEVDKSKSFFYPKASTTNSKCLDSISVINNDPLPREKTVTKRNARQYCQNASKVKKDQSSFIDMDELSQLPFHLIESQPLNIKEERKMISSKVSLLNELKNNNDDSNEKIDTEVNTNVAKDENRPAPFTGFQTAKGKSAIISESALEEVKRKFEDVEKTEHPKININTNIKTPFVGFQTAEGKHVHISESALKAAKHKFESEDLNNNISTPFTGFKTAKGSVVKISESALKAAKQKFDSDEDNNKNNIPAKTPFTGFQTANGNAVKICESSLKAAKAKFEPDIKIDSEQFTGFQTANGQNVPISNDALKAAKQKFDLIETSNPNSGFQTAKGNVVKISEHALNSAKRKFSQNDISNPDCPVSTHGFTGFQTAQGKTVKISESALKAAKQKFESEDSKISTNLSSTTPFMGFQTAKGTTVKISETALKAAKQKFESDEVDHKINISTTTPFAGFQTAKGSTVKISESALKAAKQKFDSDEDTNSTSPSTITPFTGFQTAKGSAVKISESALKAAKQKFNSEEVNHTSNISTATPFAGFQTAKGSRVKITESALKAAKQKFNSEEVNHANNISTATPFAGFQTAKGSAVKISESALKAAKQKFDSDEVSNSTSHPSTITPFTGFQTAEGKTVSISEESIKAAQSKFDADETSSLSKFTTPGFSLNAHSKYLNMEAPKAKRKIHYTTPDQYQFDRAVTMTRPLSPAVARYSTKQKDKSRSEQKPSNAQNLNNSFMTPFKSLKRSCSAKESQPKVENKKRKKNLFSYKPLFVNTIAEVKEEGMQFDDDPKDEHIRKSRFNVDGIYQSKKKTKSSFPEFVNYCSPSVYSRKELQEYGLQDSVINLSGDSALDFTFDAKKYFSLQVAISGKLALCCGFQIVINEKVEIGLNEIKSAFMKSNDIDKSLVPERWIENHFKWIVWKLAAYERRFPGQFANKCLTPFIVMEQLRYRYDKELEKAERSCLKKIYERDDISTRRMILFVSDILHAVSNNDQKCKTVIKLSDGWYEIKAGLDQPLSAFLDHKKIAIGTKLCVYGAELIGSTQACPPLQAPEDLMLMLSANSTRRASWDTKLGFQPIKQAFAVPLTSLYSDGGSVGCVNITILRKYPTQWMQKEGGRCIFRNLQQEEEAKKKYEEQKQKKMETLYASIQKEFEETTNKGTKRKRRSLSMKEIGELKDGRDIYNAIQNSIDPSTVECYLSDSQKEAVFKHKQKKQTLEQDKLRRTFQNQWQNIVEEEFPDRSVVHLQRYRICECPTLNSKSRPFKDAILTVWKPTEDINENFKEGVNLKLFNLNTSASRYKQTSCNFQLSTTNTTKYRLIEDDLCAENIDYIPRQATPIDELYTKSHVPCNEIDVVAYVLSVERQKSTEEVMYLYDGGERFLAVKVWNNPQNVKNKLEGCVIAATNLSWQKFATPSRNRIIHVQFTDFSNFSKNPKAEHLRKAMNKYQSSLTQRAIQVARSNLQQQLQTNSSIKKLPPISSIETTNNNTITVKKTISSDSKREQSFCDDLPSEKLLSRQKLQMKKRLSLDRYHNPPGLSPLQTRENGVLKSQFKPPSTLS